MLYNEVPEFKPPPRMYQCPFVDTTKDTLVRRKRKRPVLGDTKTPREHDPEPDSKTQGCKPTEYGVQPDPSWRQRLDRGETEDGPGRIPTEAKVKKPPDQEKDRDIDFESGSMPSLEPLSPISYISPISPQGHIACVNCALTQLDDPLRGERPVGCSWCNEAETEL